jgi:transcription-repair coupling factor (superfamily II helicase)
MKELKESEFKELFDERHTDQFMSSYVQDCIFETDMEVRIPDDYVNNVAERLSLYQALDHLKNKGELTQFSQELTDRFGPLPREVKELLFSFELRWLAEELGLERLVIKSEKLVGYFIANPQSPFFETEAFTYTLNAIMKHQSGFRLVQQNDKLRLVVEPIRHIKDAFEKLSLLKAPLD